MAKNQLVDDNTKITRNDFPVDFMFGTGIAAYQHEGAAAKGGRGVSIWDNFTWNSPERIADGSNGNIAVDVYHMFEEDITAMKKMGFDAFRFSISWSRILPGGRRSAGINKEGIKYYNEVIDTVIANGLEPYVTLLHFDTPQCLQDEYDGFLSKRIVADFREFVELCFWEFGDRVKYWVTINESWTYCHHGYAACIFPPSRLQPQVPLGPSGKPSQIVYRAPKSSYQNTSKYAGGGGYAEDNYDPKNCYTAGRNMLLAHAAAVQSYRTKFQQQQGGKIGITLVSHWFEPLDPKDNEDVKAATRAVDFMLGWFLEPITKGRYPQSMIDYGKDNLAPITDAEFELIKGSIDFLGSNYYTTYYAQYDPNPTGRDGYIKDQHLKTLSERNGVPIGPPASGSPDWLFIVPWGIRKLLNHVNTTYNDAHQIPSIYVTENGVDEINNTKLTPEQACRDPVRVKYHQDHLANIKLARQDGVNVVGYFAWSWSDNFEWMAGYNCRFGIIYIDFKNHLARYPKDSAIWFSKFLIKTNNPPPNKRITESKKY